MKFTTTQIIAAPRERVFAALTDPAIIQKCIEGAESLTKTGENSYDAKLKVGLAGLKGAYTGKIHIKDKKPPESYTLQMEGKGLPGWVKGTAHFTLTSTDDKTQVQCDADAQVGGLIAAVGSRLTETAAKRMIEQFFRRLSEQLA
jgi:carbon monoxide dehydrogenase subunit G